MKTAWILETVRGWRVLVPFSIGTCLAWVIFDLLKIVNLPYLPVLNVHSKYYGFVLAGVIMIVVFVTPTRSRLMYFLVGFVGNAYWEIVAFY